MGSFRNTDLRALRIAGLGLGLLVLVSCGYQMAGSGSLPAGVKTIAVRMVTNRTAESGLENKVTAAVIDELTRRGQNLITNTDQADAVLSGTINSLTDQTLARSGTITAVERQVIIHASFTLLDRKGKMLWQGRQFQANEGYAVSETNRLAAIGEATRRLAEDVYEQLTESF